MLSETKLQELCSLKPDDIISKCHQKLTLDLQDWVPNTVYSGPFTFNVHSTILNGFTKKYKFAGTDENLISFHTEYDFLNNLSRIAKVNEALSAQQRPAWDNKKKRDQWSDEQFVEQRMETLIEQILGPFDWMEVFHRCQNSNGVTVGVKFSDTSIEKKFTYPITGTPEQIELFEQYLDFDFILADAIQNLNKYSTKPKYKIVRGSNYNQVPKNNEINRSIATETTLGMFFQQGIMLWMYDLLKDFSSYFSVPSSKWHLDITKLQARHSHLAYLASIDTDIVTLDLKGASDSVGLELVRKRFPPDWFSALDLVRCKEMRISGEYVVCSMLSTMGNATTFPIEMIIFYSMAVAACDVSKNKTRSHYCDFTGGVHDTVSVYGDDIIMPRHALSLMFNALSESGFILNKDKSCYDSYPFRESCGSDFFSGLNVRPLFIENPIDLTNGSILAWLHNIANGLFQLVDRLSGGFVGLYDCELRSLNFIHSVIEEINTVTFTVPDFFPATSGLYPNVAGHLVRTDNNVSFSELAIDKHHKMLFNYLSFVYNVKETRTNAYLRYSVNLKSSLMRAFDIAESTIRASAPGFRHDLQAMAKALIYKDSEVPRFKKRKEMGGWFIKDSCGNFPSSFVNLIGAHVSDRNIVLCSSEKSLIKTLRRAARTRKRNTKNNM